MLSFSDFRSCVFVISLLTGRDFGWCDHIAVQPIAKSGTFVLAENKEFGLNLG